MPRWRAKRVPRPHGARQHRRDARDRSDHRPQPGLSGLLPRQRRAVRQDRRRRARRWTASTVRSSTSPASTPRASSRRRSSTAAAARTPASSAAAARRRTCSPRTSRATPSSGPRSAWHGPCAPVPPAHLAHRRRVGGVVLHAGAAALRLRARPRRAAGREPSPRARRRGQPLQILVLDARTGAVVLDSRSPQQTGSELGVPGDTRFRALAGATGDGVRKLGTSVPSTGSSA